MKARWVLLILAAAMASCCLVPPARAAEYFAYVASSQATAGDGDRILTYDSSGALLWTKGMTEIGAGANILGLTVHTNDLIYTTAWDGKWMLRYDRTAGKYSGGYNYTGFGNLGDITTGPDGYVYMIVNATGVRRLHPLTGAATTIVAGASETQRAVAVGPDGYLYVVWNTGIKYYDRTTGAHVGDFATGATFSRMIWHGGNAYVSDKGTGGWPALDGSVLRFAGDGTPLGAFVAAGSGGLQNPEGLAFTPNNELLVCDYYPEHKVRRYNGTTGAPIDNFITPPDSGWCRSIAVVEKDTTEHYSYICAPVATSGPYDRAFSYDSDGGLEWDSWDKTGSSPPVGYVATTVGPAGQYVYVAKREAFRVYRFDRSTGTYIGEIYMGASNQPQGLTFGADGKLYVLIDKTAAPAKRSVFRFDADTDTYEGTVVDATAHQSTTFDLAFGPDGYLYISGGNMVGKYDVSDGSFLGTFASGTSLARLVWHEGDLYVSEKGSGGWPDLDGAVLRFDGDGTSLGAFVSAGAGGLQNPEGLRFTATDGHRHLLVCDYYPEGKVRRYNAHTGHSVDDFIDPVADAWPRGIDTWAAPPPDPPPAGTLLLVH